MTEPQGNELFSTADLAEAERQRDLTTGLLPSQLLREAVAQGREILSPQPIGDDQIQPASIDLRLGEVAYRVRASFLPGARRYCATAAEAVAQIGERPGSTDDRLGGKSCDPGRFALGAADEV